VKGEDLVAKKRRISMRKIKEIIRLKSAGLSNWQIAGSCAVSPSTVSEVLHRAEEMGIDRLATESLDDEQLEKKLFPEKNQSKGSLSLAMLKSA
jgi:transposase